MKQVKGHCAGDSNALCLAVIAFLYGADMEKSGEEYRACESGLSWQTILDEYKEALEAANKSQTTVEGYHESLNDYFPFLETYGLMKPIERLGKKDLEVYVKHLREREKWPNNPHVKEENRGRLSPFTVRYRARDVKTFWSWMYKNGYIEDNPLAGYELPRVPDKLVEIINPEQFRIFLSHIEANTPEGSKYHCIMLIFYDNGMRLSELRMIGIEDIDFQGKTIKVLGKGRRERLVPITVYTRKYIVKYINGARLGLCPENCPYLFADSYGDPLTKNSIQQFMRRLLGKSGLKGVRLSPHILRHSFATQFIKNGGSLADLQTILGHKSSTTTQKYTHLIVQDIRKQHAKYSPIAQLFRNRS